MDTCAELKDILQQHADLPMEKAQTLPSTIYGNPMFSELERAAIFNDEWICIGRLDQIPRPGDYLTDSVNEQAVIAIRQKNESVKVFANTCLHRFTTLAVGSGHLSGPIVCPYHAWSYQLDGRLIATPYSTIQSESDCKAGKIHLRELACEAWCGFLFVSLATNPVPLGARLKGLEEQLPGLNMHLYRATTSHDELYGFDWKLFTENFIESYHLFMVHSRTLEPTNPTRNAVMAAGGDAYSIQFCPFVAEAKREMAHHAKPNVRPGDENMVFLAHVFPSFAVTGGHNWLWWMSAQPHGTDECKLRWGTCLTPELIADEGYKGYSSYLDEFISKANDEDVSVLLRVRDGAAGPLRRSGRLVSIEQPLWEFQRYLNRKLNGRSVPGNARTFDYSEQGSVQASKAKITA